MSIRFATREDKISIIRSTQLHSKSHKYMAISMIKDDIDNNRLIVFEENGKILGFCSLVYEANYSYTAIKRLLIPNKKTDQRASQNN